MGWLPGGYCPSLKWTGVACRPGMSVSCDTVKDRKVAAEESGDREVQVRVAGKLEQRRCSCGSDQAPGTNSISRVRCRWEIGRASCRERV